MGIILSGGRGIRMNRSAVPAVYLTLLLTLGLLFGGCGAFVDTTPPTSTLTDPPDYIFMNGPGARVMFRGTATDDTVGIKVEISFNGGTTWSEVINDPFHSRFDWSYAATTGELSSGPVVIWTKATDNDGNAESPQLWATLNAAHISTLPSPSIVDFQSFYSSANTILYLSSGSGGAYGTSTAGPVLANSTPLTVIGAGYGAAVAASNYNAPGTTYNTILQTSSTASRLLSTGKGLVLRNLRINGGRTGIYAGSSGSISLSVDHVVLVGQTEWGIFAENGTGNLASVDISVIDSMIDASSASSSVSAGGIYLNRVSYSLDDILISQLRGSTGAKAGVYAVRDPGNSGQGEITGSVFEKNDIAIWVENGSPIIASNSIFGIIDTTNGIAVTGSIGTPILRNNFVEDNDGYGVRLGGEMTPKLFRNYVEVPADGQAAVLIDEPGFDPDPDLGTSGFTQSGENNFITTSFTTNLGPWALEITSNTASGRNINGGKNLWGHRIGNSVTILNAATAPSVRDVIRENGDPGVSSGGTILIFPIWDGS